MEQKAEPVRIVCVEDVESDVELNLAQLRRAGLQCSAQRVQSGPELRAALAGFSPDLILADFSLPQFDGLQALEIARAAAPDVPFIFVSGSIGEERAVNALLCGAADYVLKSNLTRLAPAVRRALSDTRERRERRAEQARIARLDRVLRMLSGVNALMVRVRDHGELLGEVCRLAVAVGGYGIAIVYLKAGAAKGLVAQAWRGAAAEADETLRDAFTSTDSRAPSILERVVSTRNEFVCNDSAALANLPLLKSALDGAGLRSLVMLPIVLESAAIGALVLAAHEAAALGQEELQMLHEVSGNLSFGLQYLHKDTTVRFLSNFDPVSGLANRALFCERLAALIAQPGARRARYAVAIMDIARLSLINDAFGRRVGDLLLCQVAERLKARLSNERLGHFGGGTYAALLDIAGSSVEEAAEVARGHEAAVFTDPYVIDQRPIPVGVRSGLAIFPTHGSEPSALVQNAEGALRSARASGERLIQYSAEQQTQMRERLALEHRLRRALEGEQFELHYQPKVNVVSRRIEGVEALIRWRDPRAGLVSPAQFLPVLESTGLIVEVGDWIVRRAALDCQHWLNAGLPPVRVAVNISLSQLRTPDFVDVFLKALAGCSSAGAGLDIEITEASLHEELAPEVAKLKVLRNAGVRVAIDDFGTGYSSLRRLAKLPIDTLKIDPCFIREIPDDYAGRMIVKTVISLARAFRLTTVAEGVERQEQLDFLWQAGCDQSQGYLHSAALPGGEFMVLMQQGRGQFLRPPEATAPAEAASTAQ